MLVGQQLGPFAIDRELGSGAMGAVYRGRYVKTGQLVAIKVMAPGIGSTNANAAARFEREASILKQFNHPNIVRLFGIGKSHGTRYYAMEFIDGESLDRVMSRRGRMSWEEIITLGQQLCAALQHAHEQGVVHRDLKPSNLMILRDGTLKLTDFGIAKDLDVTRLTSANCTVGTAAYMSPEQCRGDPDLTHKSDLYSLGVVFYELVTGRKPFEAENAMDMFMQHVQGSFERPSRRILDIPPWMDTLICQLLEKKPEHRPLDAATVYASLGKVLEKVEAQRSAGVDAARMRVIDRPHGAPPPDDTDREMARTLLVGKGRSKRRRKREKFYQKGWFVVVGLLGLGTALIMTLYLLLRPPAAEKLYEQAKGQMNSANHDDHYAAAEGPIKQYLAHYGDRPGEQTAEIRAWAKKVQVEECEDMIANYVRKKRSAIKYNVEDAQKTIFSAVEDELDGRLSDARRKWEQVQKEQGEDPWGLTAGEHLAMLQRVAAQDETWEKHLERIRTSGKEPELAPLARDTFRAYRAEHFGAYYKQADGPDSADLLLAHKIYEETKEKALKEPGSEYYWLVVSSKKAKELETKLPVDRAAAEENRQKAIERALEFARQNLRGERDQLWYARLTGMDVVAVYEDDQPDLKPLVDEARKIIDQVNSVFVSNR